MSSIGPPTTTPKPRRRWLQFSLRRKVIRKRAAGDVVKHAISGARRGSQQIIQHALRAGFQFRVARPAGGIKHWNTVRGRVSDIIPRTQLGQTAVERIEVGKGRFQAVFCGRRGRQLVFGLPGNPTSAMVTFVLFVRPAIDGLLGRAKPGPAGGRAVLTADIVVKPGRKQFLRAVLDDGGPVLKVAPYADQRSGVLRSMAGSRALIVVRQLFAAHGERWIGRLLAGDLGNEGDGNTEYLPGTIAAVERRLGFLAHGNTRLVTRFDVDIAASRSVLEESGREI